MAQLSLEIPEVVTNRAQLLGEAGEQWLTSIPKLLKELEDEWQIKVQRQLKGGSESLTFTVDQISGIPAVLKLMLPGEYTEEMLALQLAKGKGYAKLFVRSVAHNAMLLEPLGKELADSGLDTNAQIAVICQTLQASWVQPEDVSGLITGAEKARWHMQFMEERWAAHAANPPLPRSVIDRAIGYCKARAAAFDAATSVLVHGDAHPWNTLQVPAADDQTPSYKLVDPDGLFMEPAYDLSILMREWTTETLAGDALAVGRARLELLHQLTQVKKAPIWQWALIEHVSSGLLHLQLDSPEAAEKHLSIAQAWSAS